MASTDNQIAERRPSLISSTRAGSSCIAENLPGVIESERHGGRTWVLGATTFAWERRFNKADVRRYGDEGVPDYPILAVGVADLGEKEAFLAAGSAGFFTIPHCDGYAALLIELRQARIAAVRDALLDGRLTLATPEIAQEVVAARRSGRR